MRVPQGGLLRKESSRVITLCVQQVLPLHTIAALFHRTFQFTNALRMFGFPKKSWIWIFWQFSSSVVHGRNSCERTLMVLSATKAQ